MMYLRFLIIFIFSAFLFAENLHANEYIAFSLKVAQQMILSTPQGTDYRKLHPEVFTLGGITAMNGLVYDRKTGDVILVGQRDPDRAILTLDDFVVALRARFIHGKWPLVSIDPTPETEKTQMQVVRFEGGIEDTQFGQDLFDADYRLKQIGMGLLPSGVPGLKTGWDLGMERAKQQTSKSWNIISRFWFYPVLPNVSVREDVVAIKGLKVGVFTEVMSAEIDGEKIEDPKTFQDMAGDAFARQVTDKFEALSKVHPSFSRVHGLDELVALVNAIENMEERPNLDWWFIKYQVKKVDTKRKVEILRRHEDYKVPVSGVYYKGYWEVSGGVQLMAIALRFKAGDVAALKEAVLKTKPKPDALIWGFIIGEWLIATSPDMINTEDVAVLFSHASFLQQRRRYDDAIGIYNKITMIKPDFAEAYHNKGSAYAMKGNYTEAISNYDRALEIKPDFTDAYNNRGLVYAFVDINQHGILSSSKGSYTKAIVNFNYVLSINPYDVNTHFMLGNIYHLKGQYESAIEQYNTAISLSPREAQMYKYRGIAYADIGEYKSAIEDYSYALTLTPDDSELYKYRGAAYYYENELGNAKRDWQKAGNDVNRKEKIGISVQHLLENLERRLRQ